MARDQLRLRLNQVTDMLPATLTDLLRVSLDMEVMDMEDMVMEVIMAREMLSQAMDMAVVTLLSTSPALTIMVPMVITLTTPMARDPLSQVMDMDTALPTVTNTCPDHTPTMESMFTIHTKNARLS